MGYNSYSSRRGSAPASRGRHFGGASARPSRNKRGAQYIDPAKFVKAAKPVTDEVYTPENLFSDFAVDDLIKNNLAAKGYVQPSPIQDQTIPIALLGKDVIGIANTGTGKTAAFAVPVMQKLMKEGARALIIAPTRELAQQIEQEFRSIGKGSGMKGALLIGGSNMMPQLRDLKGHPEIVIGTPGRIKDHLERRTLDLSHYNIVVLDEVDRMLDMGFINDVREILNALARERQSFFFSATMEPRVQGLIETFANEPIMVTVKTGDTADSVNQDVVRYDGSADKLAKLHDLLIAKDMKAIVFDETQRSVERLSKELIARGFEADAIHGGKTQGQRQRALDSFKKNKINILVATDVAARGIDVADITHVINFSQPNSYEDYVHRVGRAGRAGRTGTALTFVAR
jgi:ATP-dependent RNA helicase RhlE